MNHGNFRRHIIFSLLIAAIGFLSYSNTFHVPFQFDDPPNISGNAYVRDIGAYFDPAKIENYRADGPYRMRTLTYFTFAVNYLIHGDNVVGYHIVNLAIHIVNGFLVYFLVLLTFRTPYFVNQRSALRDQQSTEKGKAKTKGERKTTNNIQPPTFSPGSQFSNHFIALAASLLFVSHPIQTQAVTYIVQRLASLAGLFCLLSLVLYIKWRLVNQSRFETKVKVRDEKDSASVMTCFVLSVLSAVLAMKTKEIAFTLPLVIALYEFLFFTGGIKKRSLFLLPFMFAMLIIPMELMGLEGSFGENIGDISEVMRVQTDISRLEYLFTQLRVIVTYIRLLVFPVSQNLDYDYPVYHTFFDPNVFLSFLLLLSIFGLGVYYLLRSRMNIHPSTLTPQASSVFSEPSALNSQLSSRLIAFGIFWFFITLSVESSIIPIIDVIFEHRLYLPSVGFFIAVTAGGFLVLERVAGICKVSLPSSRSDKQGDYDFTGHKLTQRQAKIAVAVTGLIIAILSGSTYARNNVWRSEVALWEDVVRKSPSKVRPRSNLGHFYYEEGRFDEAIREYETALRLDPDDFKVYNNMGVVFKAQGRVEEAVTAYRKALALNPDDAMGHYNLGNIFREHGHFDEAIKHYYAAILLGPEVEIAVIHNNLGIAYFGQGDLEYAEREFRTAIELDPDYKAASRNLEILLRNGRDK